MIFTAMKIRDFLFYKQDSCHICLNEVTSNYICPSCLDNFEFTDGSFDLDQDKVYYPLFYNNFLKEIIRKYKFEKQTYLVKPLALILFEYIKTKKELLEADYISYVPMDKKSEFSRGYNQAKLLAEELGKYLGLPVIELFQKTKKTKEQNKLSVQERKINLKSSFAVINPCQIKDKRIILIDDLVTTGNTLKSAKRVIEKNYQLNLSFLVLSSSRIGEDNDD